MRIGLNALKLALGLPNNTRPTWTPIAMKASEVANKRMPTTGQLPLSASAAKIDSLLKNVPNGGAPVIAIVERVSKKPHGGHDLIMPCNVKSLLDPLACTILPLQQKQSHFD